LHHFIYTCDTVRLCFFRSGTWALAILLAVGFALVQVVVLTEVSTTYVSWWSWSYFTTDSQSVSQSWYRVPLRDLWPDIISCRNVAVWNLRSCIYGAPSLTRGRVCNLRCNHSMVRVTQNPKPYFTVLSETPPAWKARFPYLYLPGTGWPSYTPAHWVLFTSSRLASVLRWTLDRTPVRSLENTVLRCTLFTKGPRPLVQCRFRAVQFCASTSAAGAASRADMGSKAFPPPKLLLPTFPPPCLASSTLNTGISVRVCVEEEKVCRHDTSVPNYFLFEQRRPYDTMLCWHDPAVLGALPFKYTESIVSAASALHCTETALCYWTRTFTVVS
jgi:hypothetical protein